jgi:hypothetical protein
LTNSHFRCIYGSYADVFYAPFYMSIEAMIARRSTVCEFENRYLPLLLQEARYFDLSGGIDHIFVQMSPAYPERAAVHLANVLSFPGMLTLSDVTWRICAENPRLAWHFSQLIHGSHAPTYTDTKVHAVRNTSAFFIGSRSPLNWGSSAVAVRYKLFANFPRIPRGKIVELGGGGDQWAGADAWRQMRESDMCILAEGSAPTSRALTDALRSLCLPVVMSDEARFPFEGIFVDYSRILVQVPMIDGEGLPAAVGMVNERAVRAARRGLALMTRVIEARLREPMNINEQMWAWTWLQYAQAVVVSACKRRGLVKSYYF